MTDRFDFELRLEARLNAHAAPASRPFDAAEIAARAAAAAPRSVGLISSRPRILSWFDALPTTSRLAFVLLLLAAAVAGAVAVGTALKPPSPLPDHPALVVPNGTPSASPAPSPTAAGSAEPSASPTPAAGPSTAPAANPSAAPTATANASTAAAPADLLVVNGTPGERPCRHVDRIEIATRDVRRVVDCADRVSVTADGSRAAIGGAKGVAIIDLRDGRQVGTIETGKPTYPIEWSPTGRYLQMNVCRLRDSRPDYGPCEVTIASTTDGRLVVVPGGGPVSGYSPSYWTPDESHLVNPNGGNDTTLIGDPDGTDLVPFDPNSREAAMTRTEGDGRLSPDGTKAVVSEGRGRGQSACRSMDSSLWVTSIDAIDRHRVTSFEPGAALRAVAWSPDGTRIALVKSLPAEDRCTDGPNELWLIGADGSEHRITTPGDLDGPVMSGRIVWSPDGSRFTIEVAAGPIEARSSIDTLLVPVDGSSPVVLNDARRPVWSPDGRYLAITHTTGSPDGRLENDPLPPATIDVVHSDGSGRHRVTRPDYPEGFSYLWTAP